MMVQGWYRKGWMPIDASKWWNHGHLWRFNISSPSTRFISSYLFILGKLVALTSPGITTARTFASPFWQPSSAVPRIGQDSSVASDPKDSHVTSRVTLTKDSADSVWRVCCSAGESESMVCLILTVSLWLSSLTCFSKQNNVTSKKTHTLKSCQIKISNDIKSCDQTNKPAHSRDLGDNAYLWRKGSETPRWSAAFSGLHHLRHRKFGSPLDTVTIPDYPWYPVRKLRVWQEFP